MRVTPSRRDTWVRATGSARERALLGVLDAHCVAVLVLKVAGVWGAGSG